MSERDDVAGKAPAMPGGAGANGHAYVTHDAGGVHSANGVGGVSAVGGVDDANHRASGGGSGGQSGSGHSGGSHSGNHDDGASNSGIGREPRAAGAGMGVTRVAIQRPLLMLMAILSVLIFGLIGYSRMGVDLYPSVDFPIVVVSVIYPGASPEVVETLVSKPIEDSVAGLANLDTVQSYSSEGLATIVVQFTDKANAQTTALDVEKRVNATRATLPTDVLAPIVSKFDFGAAPIMSLALAGQRSPEQLFRLADEKIRPALESVDGVGQVTLLGGRQREIQVNVDPARLRAYGMTLQQVTQALGTENVNLPGGQVREPARNYNLRVDARFRSVTEIEDTVVASTPSGAAVRVHDLATVVDGVKEQTRLSRVNGKDAVSFTITKQSTANITSAATAVRKEITRLASELPEDAQLIIVTDSSRFIKSSLDGVQRSLLEAVVLTGLVLLVFLHSWRSTVIVLLAIPTSLIATFGMMWLQGFTLNFLSTLALALTVGILVDDSIVVLENIYRHLSMGESPRQAALNGRSEIGMAAIAITLVDVVVFTPVALMSGQIGQFFRQFGFTVVAATLFSLAISFTLTPLLASRWLRADDEHGAGLLAAFGRHWERWFAGLERRYAGLLRWSLRHRWIVVFGAVLALAGGIAMPATGIVQSEFFPAQDQGQFTLLVEMAPGTNLVTTEQAAIQIEQKLLTLPEVQTLFTSVGQTQSQGGGGGQTGTRYASITAILKGKHERHRTAAQVSREAATFGSGMPGVKVRASTPSAGGGGAQPISITVYGEDLNTLNVQAARVKEQLTALGSVVDVTNSGQAGSPEYVISIDRQRASDLGLTAAQVAATVRTAYSGSVATQLRRDSAGGTATGIDVRVQLTDDVRSDLARLASVPLLSPAKGGQVLLGQIATISPAQSPGQIQRTDRRRMITIGADLAEGKALGQVSGEVSATLARMDWPAGYKYEMGGATEDQNSTFAEFGQALLLSIVLTYMLLVALYESLVYPLVVLLALPLALVGAMAGLAISRETLNLFSLIGVIMLTGLVGKNSILVVDYTNNLRRQGMSRTEALMNAGPARLRPILMTSAALIFAQIPLVLKLEEGSETQAPLAVVVMGGMITSTLLALVFVPAMYTIMDDLQNLIGRLFRRGRSHKEGTSMGGDAQDTIDKSETPAAAPKERKLTAAATAAVATLLVAGSLLLGACQVPGGAEPARAAPAAPPPSVAVTEVRKDTVRTAYSGSGAVDAVEQVPVIPKVSGRVTRLNVEVGQSIKSGQVIAELDRAQLDIQVAQADAGLAAAKARLAQAERGPRREEVAIAASQRDAAGAQATAALQSLTTLDSQIEAARQQAQAAAAQAAAARVRLEQLRNPRPEDTTMVASQVELAKLRLAQAQMGDAQVKVAASQLEQARVALQQAQDAARPEQIRAAQAALDQAEVGLSQITEAPVRAEDLAIARMNVEAAAAGYKAAQDTVLLAGKSYNSAKQQSDNLPFLLTRAQADAQVASAEANLRNAEANLEQRRVLHDQTQATYEKLSSGAAAHDVRQAQLRVEAARAQLDATRNPDPARVKAARLSVDQAQIQLDVKSSQVTLDLQSAAEGVKQAEAQFSKLQNPGPLDLAALEEQVNAAQAQANAAQAQVDALLSQKSGAEASSEAAAASARGAEASLSLRSNPITTEDLQALRAAVQQAQAALDGARLQASESVIVSPLDGIVATRNVSTGALVGPQAPLVTLISEAVELALPVEEAHLAQVKVGQQVLLSSAAFPGETFNGTVVSVTPSADARSRTFTARIRPDNQEGKLKPGMYVQASVATEQRESVPVVPKEALLTQGGQTSVFVVDASNKATLRPVRLGLTADRLVEVLTGVIPGEKVITVGQEDLRDGQIVAPTAAVLAPAVAARR